MSITARKSGLIQEAKPESIETGLKSVATGIVDHGTGDGTQTVLKGETVLLAGGYAGGGTAGSVYRRVAADASINLGTEDYSATANWTLEGTNAAFTARSEATRNLIDAVPDAAGKSTSNVVRTQNP